MVLRNINEDNFKPLYFDKASHPKALVNIMVLILIFKELKGISYDELMESIIEKKIEQIDPLTYVYTVECPYQKAVSTLTKQRHKIRFETKVCMLCLLKENCRVFKTRDGTILHMKITCKTNVTGIS